ncbi:MAG: serine hydrolase domain-containing protein [Bacteroidota bacterium]
MKLKIVFFTLLLILAAGVLSAQTNLLSGKSESEAKIQLAGLWINELINYHEIPGLAIGIVYDQDMIFSKGFGFANLVKKTEITEETLFRIASITKLFTGTAIMQLRDKGLLNLDDPIREHLSWFKIKNSFEGAKEVTIRHLLTHTSGLPREADFPYWTDHKFPTKEQIVETLPNQTMLYPPDEKYKYSNLGITLLGEIIESVSGMPYEKYINENILTPLEMNDTRVNLKDEDFSKLATGYFAKSKEDERKITPFTDSKGITAAANISSCVKDMAKFISLQFNYDNHKNAILDGNTLKEMHRVQWIQPGWESGWGLAFSTFKDKDRVYVGHAGWVAGYRSQILFSPAEKIGVIVMINTEDYSPYTIAKKIYELAAPAIKKEFEKPDKEDYSYNTSWEKFVGKYIDPWNWRTDVVILNKKLYFYDYGFPPRENPESNLTLLYPEAENVFRNAKPFGEKVVFELGADGSVKQIKVAENYIYPLGKFLGKHKNE